MRRINRSKPPHYFVFRCPRISQYSKTLTVGLHRTYSLVVTGGNRHSFARGTCESRQTTGAGSVDGPSTGASNRAVREDSRRMVKGGWRKTVVSSSAFRRCRLRNRFRHLRRRNDASNCRSSVRRSTSQTADADTCRVIPTSSRQTTTRRTASKIRPVSIGKTNSRR